MANARTPKHNSTSSIENCPAAANDEVMSRVSTKATPNLNRGRSTYAGDMRPIVKLLPRRTATSRRASHSGALARSLNMTRYEQGTTSDHLATTSVSRRAAGLSLRKRKGCGGLGAADDSFTAMKSSRLARRRATFSVPVTPRRKASRVPCVVPRATRNVNARPTPKMRELFVGHTPNFVAQAESELPATIDQPTGHPTCHLPFRITSRVIWRRRRTLRRDVIAPRGKRRPPFETARCASSG